MKIRIEIGDVVFEAPLEGAIDRVVITDIGYSRIAVIKEIRAFTNWGLKEAKDASEGCRPTFTRQHVADLDGFAKALRTAGATVLDEGAVNVRGVLAKVLEAIGYLPNNAPTAEAN